MNKLEVLHLKKKLLTSALITTTTLEALNLGKINAYAMKREAKITMYYDIANTETPLAIEDLITHYSGVYGLDNEKVYDIIYDLTNGFDNYTWHTFNHIDGHIYESKESAIIAITNDIYKNPTNYGFKNRSEVAGEIIESDFSFEELVEKHADLQYINKNIPATIGHIECGENMNSNLYINQNNCGGFRGNDGWMSFPTKEAGVIYLINLLKNSYGCTIDSDKELFNRIAQKYCPDNPDHWISLAYNIYNNIENDFYYYAPNINYHRAFPNRRLLK